MQLLPLILVLSWMAVSGFTTVQPTAHQSTRVTSTTLFMFDWLKPKPPPKKNDDQKETNVEKKDDMFGNFFNSMNSSPPATAPAPAEVPEETKTATRDEPTEPAVESKSEAETKEKNPAKAAPSTATSSTGKRSDGKVSWFNSQKGFGFIVPDDLSLTMSEKNDIFVHHSAIQDPDAGFKKLVVGERVQFEIEIDAEGRTRAVHVTGPDSGPVQAAVRRAEQKTE